MKLALERLVPLALPVLIVFAITIRGNASSARAADPTIDAVIKFKQEADKELPATEAGVLMKLTVKQGDRVKAGQEIGLIDDREPQVQKKVAEWALSGAVQRWKDDIEIRYAKAQAEFTKAKYDKMKETNRLAAKAVSEVELKEAELDWIRSKLGIEKSQHDQKLAEYEAWTKKAELDAAELGIKRRMIVAPFDGEIIEVLRKQDEWVNPGDQILRLARRDVMDVVAAVDQSQYDRSQVRNCEIMVEVELAGGRRESTKGRIFYVSPVVRYDGKYDVRAEIPNREEYGDWMLPDGQPAKMTIHLNTAGGAATQVTRRP